MKCWHCNKELRWMQDEDISEESERYNMVTFLNCDYCESLTEVYLPKEKEKDDNSKPSIPTTQ
jgi:uncharacterized protein with PIN domain